MSHRISEYNVSVNKLKVTKGLILILETQSDRNNELTDQRNQRIEEMRERASLYSGSEARSRHGSVSSNQTTESATGIRNPKNPCMVSKDVYKAEMDSSKNGDLHEQGFVKVAMKKFESHMETYNSAHCTGCCEFWPTTQKDYQSTAFKCKQCKESKK